MFFMYILIFSSKVQLVQSMGSVAKDKVNRALEEKRVHARTELLESEKEYYSRLCVLCECFMKPLIAFVDLELQNMESESSTSPALADLTPSQAVQVRAVFGNISQIRDLTKHLLDDLEPTIKNDGKVCTSLYITYVCIFELVSLLFFYIRSLSLCCCGSWVPYLSTSLHISVCIWPIIKPMMKAASL